MPETTQFRIGADARCVDGPCGKVTRVVVEPVAREVTHLVVEPFHRQGIGRLIPLGLVESAGEAVRLRCTRAEFEQLELAEETQFLPGSSGLMGYESGEMYAWPHFGMGVDLGLGVGNATEPLILDKVPSGEIAIRRGDHVHATDGDIGRVQGLVIDRQYHQVTHVLLQEGHLLNRKQVAIPITAVIEVADIIRLNLAKHEVQELPAVDLDDLAS